MSNNGFSEGTAKKRPEGGEAGSYTVAGREGQRLNKALGRRQEED